MNRYPSDPNCIRAEYDGDTIDFLLDSSYSMYAPPDAITDTLAEARCMARLPPSTRRIIHEAKRHGARIIATR